MGELPREDELIKIFARLGFTTCSRAMMAVLRRAKKAADISDVTVLLDGETGTGKQILAHAIHKLDQKRGAFPFVTVHCSTTHRTPRVPQERNTP